ncbi:glycosyltransferase family 2 protein [Tenacibaculum aiptasiae]|uniref:glycosyltransferase family 2 protein n=1 Tax=Tenacibaculum aiptasiae TaxID=426481 RepID=UPI003B58B9E9
MLSTVIITCNRINLLKKTFENNISNALTCGGEVIVVDNGSDDGTSTYLQDCAKKYKFITVITNEKNLGIAPARNLGLKKAKFDVILCVDDDMMISNENYLKCKTIFLKHKNAGVVAPLCLDYESKKHMNNTLGKDSSYEISNHHGSFGIFLREAVVKAGYLDEECIYGGEERSLCMKVHIQGYDILFDPEIQGIHIDTVNRKKPNLFRVKMRVYNNVRLNFKYLPFFKALKFSIRIFLSYFKYSLWHFGIGKKIIICQYFVKGMRDGLKTKKVVPISTKKYYSNPKLTPDFGNSSYF